jgi:hypothetical protein
MSFNSDNDFALIVLIHFFNFTLTFDLRLLHFDLLPFMVLSCPG